MAMMIGDRIELDGIPTFFVDQGAGPTVLLVHGSSPGGDGLFAWSPLFHMAVDAPCLHEFVATTKGGKVTGLRAMDVAKRLLDYGVYAPTVYFPITVPEALMFEPTETESKRSLDELGAICARILEEAEADLDQVQAAPHTTPVGRVDEVGAARRPILRWSAHS